MSSEKLKKYKNDLAFFGKYKYEELSEDAKITARECIDRNGGDIREISKEQFDRMKNDYKKNVTRI